jgi:2-aminoadipate transaminase
MHTSAIREILKVTERPDILSFAGGLPAPELFPAEALARAHAEVFASQSGAALQYSTTEGHRPLREWISQDMLRRGLPCSVEQILITHGSQQGIDLVSKILLDPGDAVLVEDPTYLAALQTFAGFEAQVMPVDSDDQGMRVDSAEKALRTVRPKFIYLVPTFHNPKGTTLSPERREALVELAARHQVPILEDDPYSELRYSGEPLPPLASYRLGSVVYLSTFSKTLAPGLRLGWVVAPEEVIRTLTVAKQASDLHTSTLEQSAVAKLLETFDLRAHLGRLRHTYGARRDTMLAALKEELPVGCRWTHPEGGLFLWLQLPMGVRAQTLLEDALREKVAFVPGGPFCLRPQARDHIRLNFSNQPPTLIAEGIKRLGRCLSGRD